MIRVLLADDNRLVREGWSALLRRLSEVAVVGQARDGREAVELAMRLQPDVILMDFQMPGLNGVQATRQIVERQADTKVLMVTQTLDETSIRAAMEHGACGYVSKSDAFQELLPALLALRAKQSYFSKTIRGQYPRLLEELRGPTFQKHELPEASWVILRDALKRAKEEARFGREWAHTVRQQTQVERARAGFFRLEASSMRTQSQTTRASAHRLVTARRDADVSRLAAS